MKYVLVILVMLVSMVAKAQTDTDSVGAYAVLGDNVVQMKRITHTAIKGSGGLAAAATFGVAKVKAKLEFKGNTSQHQFEDKAVIRLYFGNAAPQDMANLYMFSPATYSIDNFDVARFEVKKGKRLLTGVSASILGSKLGVDIDESLTIETVELRPNVYEITIQGEPGEYCIMSTANGTGGFGGVFDFTIK